MSSEVRLTVTNRSVAIPIQPARDSWLQHIPRAFSVQQPALAKCGQRHSMDYSASGRMYGNSSTSRIDAASVNSITRRSMPMPSPAVGGIPYSSARM